jgi:hypothetical protein
MEPLIFYSTGNAVKGSPMAPATPAPRTIIPPAQTQQSNPIPKEGLTNVATDAKGAPNIFKQQQNTPKAQETKATSDLDTIHWRSDCESLSKKYKEMAGDVENLMKAQASNEHFLKQQHHSEVSSLKRDLKSAREIGQERAAQVLAMKTTLVDKDKAIITMKRFEMVLLNRIEGVCADRDSQQDRAAQGLAMMKATLSERDKVILALRRRETHLQSRLKEVCDISQRLGALTNEKDELDTKLQKALEDL